jgi:histidine triad (HIT) family protein
MKCDYCEIVKRKVKAEVVYEDDKVMAIVKDLAAFPGQICVFPKEHYTILEMVPDAIVNHLFKIVNKLGIAIFEGLGVQGTNIVVQNGTAAGQTTPHFCVDIIPRRERDGLDFQWKIKQLMEEETDTAYLMLKEEGEKLIVGVDVKEEVFHDDKTEMITEKEGEENYMVKQLKRMP